MAADAPRFHDWRKLDQGAVRKALTGIGANPSNPDLWEATILALHTYWAALMVLAGREGKRRARARHREWFRNVAKRADRFASELETPARAEQEAGYIRHALAPTVLGELNALDKMARDLRTFAEKARNIDQPQPLLDRKSGPNDEDLRRFVREVGQIYRGVTGTGPTTTYNPTKDSYAPAVNFLHDLWQCVASGNRDASTFARIGRDVWSAK